MRCKWCEQQQQRQKVQLIRQVHDHETSVQQFMCSIKHWRITIEHRHCIYALQMVPATAATTDATKEPCVSRCMTLA
jgi:hypothetical protein